MSDLVTDSPTDEDLLGYIRYTEPLGKRIISIDNKNTPFTIGIYGEWGSGKTSFLKMVEKSLKDEDIYPVWFNAWKYNQEDNLWAALLQTILDQARINGGLFRKIWVRIKIAWNLINFRAGWWEVTKGALIFLIRLLVISLGIAVIVSPQARIISLLNSIYITLFPGSPAVISSIQPYAVKAIALMLATAAANPFDFIKLFSDKLGIDFSKLKRKYSYRAHIAFLDEFSGEFRKIIQLIGRGKPLVIIIDDLDRCLPEKLIQVLEAIKVFLDVEGCVFLLAVDRNFIEKTISVRYKHFTDTDKENGENKRNPASLIGENYLEKIIQLPLALPPISDTQFQYFINRIFSDESTRECSEVFIRCLPRNPRKVKRILHIFLFIKGLAKEEIDSGIILPSLLAKIVIIQHQYRQLYDDLARFQELLSALEDFYATDNIDSSLERIEDALLREKLKEVTALYPNLRKILEVRVNEKDTFKGVNLAQYLSLTRPVVVDQKDSEATSNQQKLSLGEYLLYVKSNASPINLLGMEKISEENKKELLNFEFDMDGTHITPDYLFQNTVRSVIVGAPGIGKTTFLNYVANVFATAMLENDDSLVRVSLGIRETLVPIQIRLNAFGSFIEKHQIPQPTVTDLIDFLKEHYQNLNINFPTNYFETLFRRGDCILLLDALDEVRQEQRPVIINTIQTIANRYPVMRIVLTSRPSPYSLELRTNFVHLKMNGLNDNQIFTYIDRIGASMKNTNRDSEDYWKRFKDAINFNIKLKELARNPFFLSIMVNQYKYSARLPDTRVGLINEFVDTTLSYLLKRMKNADKVREKNNVLGISVEEVRCLLTALSKSGNTIGYTYQEKNVISLFAGELEKMGYTGNDVWRIAENTFELLVERAGILTMVQPGLYEFTSLIFKEYFAELGEDRGRLPDLQ